MIIHAMSSNPTKMARAKARARQGTLSEGVVADRTRKRYNEQIRIFFEFIKNNDMAIGNNTELDIATCALIEQYWQEGESKGDCHCLYASVRDHFIHRSPLLHGAKRLMRAWDKRELSAKAWPLTAPMMRGVAGTLARLGHRDCGIGVVLMFHCLLRTGELLALRCGQISLDAGGCGGVIVLRETKTGQRLNVVESVTIECGIVATLVSELLRGKAPGDKFISASSWDFRAHYRRAVKILGLDDQLYTPYSCRRGGATYDFKWHGKMEKTLIRGRWASSRSARIYITEGLAVIGEQHLSAKQQGIFKEAERHLQLRRQDR